ncbi:MAG: hydrogenase, partial [Clostridiaceae bacterium]|nr:hydrogenase [Clostridiaceae bacterium]
MKTGKLTPQELNEIVFSRLPPLGPGIVCGPGNGL